jgi:hypothetical protein
MASPLLIGAGTSPHWPVAALARRRTGASPQILIDASKHCIPVVADPIHRTVDQRLWWHMMMSRDAAKPREWCNATIRNFVEMHGSTKTALQS